MKQGAAVMAVAAALVLVVPPGAQAQSGSGDWQVAIAPYLWAAGLDGTMTIAEQEQDFDLPFSTIIDNLDFALMGHFDMRNERWVLMSDLIYVDLEDRQELEHGSVTAGLELTLIEAVAGYRVSPAVSLLAGARWADMAASIRASGEVAAGDADAGESWLDPLLGVHVLETLSERWWFGLRADVGGFGVGSELAWQAYADLGYRVSKTVSIIVGYHALDLDYESGGDVRGADLDVRLSGPQLGVVFAF